MLIIGKRNLNKLWEYRAGAHGEKLFLTFEDIEENVVSFSYQEFNNLINRTANALLNLGLRQGDKLVLHLPNCPEFLLFWFGLARMGGVMVPTNTLSTADELEYILTHSESAGLVTEPAYLEKFLSILDRCPNVRHVILARTADTPPGTLLFDDLLKDSSALPPGIAVDEMTEAAMLYTSGTTARPKGVLITHGNYLYVGEVMAKHLRLTPEDRQMVVLPLFHANAQYYSFMSALTVGASVALMERFSASRFIHQARRHQATVVSLFAAPMRMILNQPPTPVDGDNSLRLAFFAQNLTQSQLDEFESRFQVPLIQLYGMTETIGVPTINPVDGPRKNHGIGLPALGYEVKVVDGNGREVPPGAVGQMIVKGLPGLSLMKGYFKNPEATAEAVKDGWLYTGDNAYVDEDGYLFFVDRAKDMIKRAGENVASSEVEMVINQHPKVFESAVIGVPDEIRDEAIKAYVVLKAGETATAAEIIDFCAQKLSKFKVPSFIEFCDQLPKTSVGKIQKHILRKEEQIKN